MWATAPQEIFAWLQVCCLHIGCVGSQLQQFYTITTGSAGADTCSGRRSTAEPSDALGSRKLRPLSFVPAALVLMLLVPFAAATVAPEQPEASADRQLASSRIATVVCSAVSHLFTVDIATILVIPTTD